MAKRNSNDYIPTEADYIAQHDAMREYQESHPDPRHKYIAKFTYNNIPMTEEVWELNADAAERHCRDQWSKVGVYLYDLKISSTDDTEKKIEG